MWFCRFFRRFATIRFNEINKSYELFELFSSCLSRYQLSTDFETETLCLVGIFYPSNRFSNSSNKLSDILDSFLLSVSSWPFSCEHFLSNHISLDRILRKNMKSIESCDDERVALIRAWFDYLWSRCENQNWMASVSDALKSHANFVSSFCRERRERWLVSFSFYRFFSVSIFEGHKIHYARETKFNVRAI